MLSCTCLHSEPTLDVETVCHVCHTQHNGFHEYIQGVAPCILAHGNGWWSKCQAHTYIKTSIRHRNANHASLSRKIHTYKMSY